MIGPLSWKSELEAPLTEYFEACCTEDIRTIFPQHILCRKMIYVLKINNDDLFSSKEGF